MDRLVGLPQRTAPARRSVHRTLNGIRVVAASALAAAALSSVGVASVVGAPPAGATTPVPSPIPKAPAPVYSENFEDRAVPDPVVVTSYTAAGEQTYTADPCPGDVLEFNAPLAAGSSCAGTDNATQVLDSESAVRQMAFALGVHAGAVSPASNHILAVYRARNRGAATVELQTVKPIVFVATPRFLVLRVDAAATNCTASASQYRFYLTSGTAPTPIGGLTNPCASEPR